MKNWQPPPPRSKPTHIVWRHETCNMAILMPGYEGLDDSYGVPCRPVTTRIALVWGSPTPSGQEFDTLEDAMAVGDMIAANQKEN